MHSYSRYVSHSTKSCILKILNLKQRADCNLFAEVEEKSFKVPKFIFKSPKLISWKLLLDRYLFKI